MRYKLFLFLAFLAIKQLHAATPDMLPVPKDGTIHVAFVLENGATMIDFAGPWEVFQDVMMTSDGKGMRKMSDDMKMPFQLFTVAETKEPRRVSGGMKIVPDYTYDDAPAANVIVIPAQGSSARRKAWLQDMSKKADVVFSVCTGAFVVADAGLLDGKKATTHHWFQDRFHEKFPQIELEKTARFVDNGKIITAAGLSSGIDAALHIVERYYGRDVAQATAEYMEYHSTLF